MLLSRYLGLSLIVLSIVATASCDSASGPSDSGALGDPVPMIFSPANASPGDPTSVAPFFGGIRLGGIVSIPCSPYAIGAFAFRQEQRVDITVIARPLGTCGLAPGVLGYSAEIRGLLPGVYHVRVVHRYADGSLPDSTMWDVDVTVLNPGARAAT